MTPGEFREDIEIVRPSGTPSASGYVTPAYLSVLKAKARVRGVRSYTQDTRGAQQWSETLEFATWYRAEPDSACQVLWRGTYYQIERISPLPENLMYMVIYAHSVRRVGA